jgi:hypothetical protein
MANLGDVTSHREKPVSVGRLPPESHPQGARDRLDLAGATALKENHHPEHDAAHAENEEDHDDATRRIEVRAAAAAPRGQDEWRGEEQKRARHGPQFQGEAIFHQYGFLRGEVKSAGGEQNFPTLTSAR